MGKTAAFPRMTPSAERSLAPADFALNRRDPSLDGDFTHVCPIGVPEGRLFESNLALNDNISYYSREKSMN
jgi:hypothetical protein